MSQGFVAGDLHVWRSLELRPVRVAIVRNAGPPGADSAVGKTNWRRLGQRSLRCGRRQLVSGRMDRPSLVSAMSLYAPLNVRITTPVLELRGATDAEAHGEGAVDNVGSNAVSERLGYEPNGFAWATHQDSKVLGQRRRSRTRCLAAPLPKQHHPDRCCRGADSCSASTSPTRRIPTDGPSRTTSGIAWRHVGGVSNVVTRSSG